MISVIIPVYNVEKYIARCIESILNQTFQDFEIVIVNDATNDNSMAIVQKYASKYPRIKAFHNLKNMGLMWTRRVGYLNASGDYFIFCDSDDYLPENALEILYNSIKNSGADIVIGNYQYVNAEGVTGRVSNNVLKYGSTSKDVYKSLLKAELAHSLWGKIYDAKLFNDYKYITHEDFTNAEDGLLFYQLIQNASKTISIKETVYYYFSNNQSATQKPLSEKAIKSIVTYWNFIDEMFKNDIELYKYAQAKYAREFLSLLRGKCSKDIILKELTISNFEDLLKCKNLLRLFKIKDVVKYYLMIKYYRL